MKLTLEEIKLISCVSKQINYHILETSQHEVNVDEKGW